MVTRGLCSMAVVMAVSAGAALAAPPQAPQRMASAPAGAPADRTSKAAEALGRGELLEALARSDEAVRAEPKNGWAHYNRAAALAGLKRVDEAVAAYDAAAAGFPAKDVRARSLALWGKAHLMYRIGRCTEASQVFSEYAKVIGPIDPQGAALADDRTASCRPAEGSSETAAAAPIAASASASASTEAAPMAAKETAPAATQPPKAEPTESKSALPSLAKP